MFATVVMQSYIFIPTTHIYFLEFSSPNSASGGAAWPPADVRSVGRSVRLPSTTVRRHRLTLLVLYRSFLNKCASSPSTSVNHSSTHLAGHSSSLPLTSHSPSPQKNPLLLFWQDRHLGILCILMEEWCWRVYCSCIWICYECGYSDHWIIIVIMIIIIATFVDDFLLMQWMKMPFSFLFVAFFFGIHRNLYFSGGQLEIGIRK